MPARLRWSSRASPRGRAGSREEVAQGPVGVPVGAQQVGAEVADGPVLVGGAQQFQDGEAVADGGVGGGAEDRPDLVGGAAAPALAGGVHLPGAVHPQVGVEGEAALDAGEEVLAARGDVQDGAAGEIGRGELGHAEVGAGQQPARRGRRAAAARSARRCLLRAWVQDGTGGRGGAEGTGAVGAAAGRRRCGRRRVARQRAAQAAGCRVEARALQEGAERGGEGGGAVDALHRDRAEGARAGGRGQGLGAPRGGGGRRRAPAVRVGGPGQQGLAAALHVERQLAVDQDDQGARLAARLVPGAVGRLGPGQGGAVGVRRVGGGQDEARAGVRRAALRAVRGRWHTARSRSTAPSIANWAAPSPSTT